MSGLGFRAKRDVVCGAAALATASAGVGVYVWFVASRFLPLAYTDRPLEYVFLGASPALLAAATVAAAVALTLLHAALIRSTAGRRWAGASLGYLWPVAMLGLAPLGALPLASTDRQYFSVTSYVLVDLRWWWTAGLLGVALARIDRLRGNPWRWRIAQHVGRLSPAKRTFAAEAALFALVVGFAIGSNTYLRFTSVLHGDEPKYLRLAENLYQGRGLDVAHQQTMEELSLNYSPPVWRNVSLFVAAVRQDAGFLVDDARTFLSNGLAVPYNRGEFVEGWFVVGRNGGFYQVHNPGLSFLLFPAYFIDRHFISSSAGYQGVFPTALPVTNLFFLIVWSVWAVLVFRLLRLCLGEPALAWLLAAAATLTLPVSAFAFQIYPETIAGLIVTAVCLWLLGPRAKTSGVWAAVAAGCAVGFLPWLHVRFLVMSLALALWAAWSVRDRRMAFGAAWMVMIALLSLYSYHLTGSLRPDAMYETEGGASPWRIADSLQSMRAYPLDRIWGVLPHAPVYLLAIPGWLLAVRLRVKAAALAALLIVALVVPSSGHGFMGAGATPLRHLVAIVPLAMVLLGLMLRHWRRSVWVRVAFGILLVISLDAALAYNLNHRKEVGRMVFDGVSGWAPNLMFPWTHGDAWAHRRGTFELFLIWAAGLGALLLIGLRARSNVDGRGSVGVRHATAGVAVFVAIASGLTALGGEWIRMDYLRPLDGARRDAIKYAMARDRCRICYSSFRGEVGRANVIADAEHALKFVAVRDDVRTSEDAVFEVSALARDGPGWGVLAIDFGDDQVARVDLLGTTRVRHTYLNPGLRKVSARYQPHDGAVQYGTAEVAVRPSTVSLDTVAALPDAVRRAPARERVTRVAISDGHVLVDVASGARPERVWLVAWSGGRWEVVDGAASGTWVGVMASGSGWRTDPLVLRWPPASAAIGAPVFVFP